MSFETFLETIECPICSSKDYKVIKKNNYSEMNLNNLLKTYNSSSDSKLIDQLVECFQCRLVYLNPRIKSNIILESYSEAVDPKFVSQNPMRMKTFRNFFYRWIKKHNINPS